MPLSCWNNISPIDISSGFEYIFENKLRYPGISSFLPMWLAFSISLNSCVTSAFFPLNHCNAFFAFLFLSTNHKTMKITTTVLGIWRRGKTKIYILRIHTKLTSADVPLWSFGYEEHAHQERYRNTSAENGQHLPVEVLSGNEAQQNSAVAQSSGQKT